MPTRSTLLERVSPYLLPSNLAYPICPNTVPNFYLASGLCIMQYAMLTVQCVMSHIPVLNQLPFSGGIFIQVAHLSTLIVVVQTIVQHNAQSSV